MGFVMFGKLFSLLCYEKTFGEMLGLTQTSDESAFMNNAHKTFLRYSFVSMDNLSIRKRKIRSSLGLLGI